MLLAYVDESFSDDWYYIVALLVNGHQAVAITRGLDEVVEEHLLRKEDLNNAELHGFELFQGRGDWSELPPRLRIGVYGKVFDVISKQKAKLIIRGVHRPGLLNRHYLSENPHTVVLQHLLERIDEHVSRGHDYALVVADEVSHQAQHRADFALYRQQGTKGYRRRKLTRILDTLHFAPSYASRLVQAADMVAYLHRRIETHTETDARATRANQALWERIAPCVVHKHCWKPHTDARRPRIAGPKAGSLTPPKRSSPA